MQKLTQKGSWPKHEIYTTKFLGKKVGSDLALDKDFLNRKPIAQTLKKLTNWTLSKLKHFTPHRCW